MAAAKQAIEAHGWGKPQYYHLVPADIDCMIEHIQVACRFNVGPGIVDLTAEDLNEFAKEYSVDFSSFGT
jgi:hypothetical protein